MAAPLRPFGLVAWACRCTDARRREKRASDVMNCNPKTKRLVVPIVKCSMMETVFPNGPPMGHDGDGFGLGKTGFEEGS